MSTNLFSTLKKWDIEFSIGPDMLKNILDYMTSFRNEVNFKFFRDRIFIQARSTDNTQYTDVRIEAEGVNDYIVNIPEDIEDRYNNFSKEEQISFRNISVNYEGAHKKVCVNMIDKSNNTPLNEISTFVGKNLVKVRIDTLAEKKIEFSTQKGLYIWMRLMDPNNEDAKAVENMPNVVNKIRNDPNIGKAILTMEPGLFKKLCFLGGKPGKESSSHTRGLFEIDAEKGMSIGSGDNMRGRVLKIGVRGSNLETYDEYDGGIKYDKVTSSNVNEDITSSNNGEDEDNYGESESDVVIGAGSDTGSDTDIFSDTDSTENVPDLMVEAAFLTDKDIYGKKKDKKIETDEDKKVDKKKKKFKEEENVMMDDAITNDLLSAEVGTNQKMWMEIPFLSPILKLGGLAPIVIEMREGKPMVVIQKPFNDTEVMLTIAPRLESDDD